MPNRAIPFKKNISQERLKELFIYNPDTGVFTRKTSGRGYYIGKVAGCLKPNGYRCLRVDDKLYLEHRLAFLYVHGYIPENEIDHINRERADNRIANLREASRSCNSRNSSIGRNNKTGIIGVHFDKQTGKYRAGITAKKKGIKLGRYETLFEAAMARWKAEVEHNFPSCNTTSSAHQYLLKHA